MNPDTIFELFKTLRVLIRWLGILGVAYFISITTIKLADRDLVHLNVLINSLLNITGNVYVSYIITIGATIYGYIERRLRRKNEKTSSARIEKLEQILQSKSNKTEQ